MSQTVTPHLHIQGAAEAIEFYKKAFGATEELRLTEPGGRIGHAQLRIGDSLVMLADEYPEYNVVGPRSLGGSAVSLSLQVDDVDGVVARAVAAGAKLLRPITDEFYGERSGKIEDPFGHLWQVSTLKEEISSEEMQRRFEALFS